MAYPGKLHRETYAKANVNTYFFVQLKDFKRSRSHVELFWITRNLFTIQPDDACLYGILTGRVWWSWFSQLTLCQRAIAAHSRRSKGAGLKRFPVCGTRVFDEFWLFNSKYTPRWRQQPGSDLTDRSLVCPTAKINWAALRQSPSFEKTRPPPKELSWNCTA